MTYRNLFIGMENKVTLDNGQTVIPINFDNGATTAPLKCTLKAIEKDIPYYGALGRSTGQKPYYCTENYEKARTELLDFFHLSPDGEHSVIYVKSATEGLNLLAYALCHNRHNIILTTRMEHHANDLPWRYHAGKVVYADLDSKGRLQPDAIEAKLKEYHGHIQYVSVTGASNVTGYINDIHLLARICHHYGAKIIVDAAQLVAHRAIDMAGSCPEEQVDFLVFSAHKAYAPFGCGAVIGLKNILNKSVPILIGGSCVNQVFDQGMRLMEPPKRYEAGTQNYFGVIAMITALKELKAIGFDRIEAHENHLKEQLLDSLLSLDAVTVYGDLTKTDDRLGVMTFNIPGRHHKETAKQLAWQYGITVRSGKFCAHPYVTRLLSIPNVSSNAVLLKNSGMIRVSLGLYNTNMEIHRFIHSLSLILSNNDS